MTVREKLEEMLVSNGMSDQQAIEVMNIAIPKLNSIKDYKITFDRPANEYPDCVYTILFIFIMPIALKWIEENKPQAWFKSMFE